jgi:hypothetical protein
MTAGVIIFFGTGGGITTHSNGYNFSRRPGTAKI